MYPTKPPIQIKDTSKTAMTYVVLKHIIVFASIIITRLSFVTYSLFA